MKIFIVISTILALTAALPTGTQESGLKREKKSASYGTGPSLYGQAPAAPSLYGPAPAPAPVAAPCAASHAAPAAPIAFYLAPASHLPTGLQYRSENENEELESLMMSDNFDHMQARSYGGYGIPAAAPAAAAGGYAIAAPAPAPAAGPALGLFPKANLGGCAIPLLLSCAPSVTAGKLLKSQQASYPAAAPSYSYRSHFDGDANMEMKDAVMEKEDHISQWADMERAGNPEVHHHHMLSSDGSLTGPQHKHHNHMITGAFPHNPMHTFPNH